MKTVAIIQCDINYRFITTINDILGVHTELTHLSDYKLTGNKDRELIDLCKQFTATNYFSGLIAQSFLHEERFKEAGIDVQWMRYDE